MMGRDRLGRGLRRLGPGLLAAAGLCLVCTTEGMKHKKPSPEPFISYSPEQIQREILRLEKLRADSTAGQRADDAAPLSRPELVADLFHLMVHPKNPEPDYGRALDCAKFLFENVPQQRLYYANWGRLLGQYVKLSDERDSLRAAVEQGSEKRNDLKYCQHQTRQQAQQIDSLTVILEEQAETIGKLHQLDVQMERQRSGIR